MDTPTKKKIQARGLPAGFGINVPESVRRPVELGDYLDDDPPAKPEPIRPQPANPILGATASPAGEAVAPRPAPRPSPPTINHQPPAIHRHARKNPPRKQINMRPETLRKAADLLRDVQEYGPQPDTKASEIFEALVDLLHDARPYLDVSQVPPRGKWGEPTARAFPQHLKHAFARAILHADAAARGRAA